MSTDRVFISGIGCIGDFGAGKNEFISHFSGTTSEKKKITDFDFDDYIDASKLRRADENACFSAAAAKLALDDADLDLSGIPSEKIALVVATTHGPIAYALEYHEEMVLGEPHMVSPLLFSNSLPNTMASYVSNIFNISGITTTFSGYNAVMQAVKYGKELVSSGYFEVCLAGGVDIYNDIFKEAYINCVNQPDALAESFGGSGMLVLESEKTIGPRQGSPYAEILGVNAFTVNCSRVLKKEEVSFPDLIKQTETGFDEIKCLITSRAENKGIKKAADMIRKKTGSNIPFIECSDLFGSTFSAGEIFKMIYGVLCVSNEELYAGKYEKSEELRDKNKVMVTSITMLGDIGSVLLGGCGREF